MVFYYDKILWSNFMKQFFLNHVSKNYLFKLGRCNPS